MAAYKSSTLRVLVSGGENLQKVYEKLTKGTLVELVRESEDKVAVYYERKKFFSSKQEYLGYLTNPSIAADMAKADKILSSQVAGFYMQDWGSQLILQITMEWEE